MFKSPTTPADPVQGVVAGLAGLAADFQMPLAQFMSHTDRIVHGTTVATNAVLTGEGAKTALLTTKGFRDALEMRRGYRSEIFNNSRPAPAPLVPRSRRMGITERIDAQGRIETPLEIEDVWHALRACREQKVDAVAVCLLFSFLNPTHERMIADLAQQHFPELYLSISSEILPEIGEYERASTVAINSFVGPIMSSYLNRVERELRAQGFGGTLLIMQSNGGLTSVANVRNEPVTTVLSGPASGPSAAAYYAKACGISDIITIDMGGTSFDACLLKDGAPTLTYDGEMGGHRIKTPMVDVNVVGAGGGSIAWLDAGGLLRVGPKSAGSVPGPACYGTGGLEPTVTDADLVLGYVNPEFFLGGRIALQREAAIGVIEKRIASPLRIDVVEAAAGIVRVVTSNMSDGIEKISVRKGFDPREFALMVGGGAGPVHAGTIAAMLDVPQVLIPQSASVMCAFGMLASLLKHCYVRTCIFDVSAIASSQAAKLWGEMRREAIETLQSEGADQRSVRITYSADMRYVGQASKLEILLEEYDVFAENPAQLAEQFHRTHELVYGYSDLGSEVQCINLRVTATASGTDVRLPRLEYAGENSSPAYKSHRKVYFEPQGFVDTPVFDGARLNHGNLILGPAVVERADTTVIVPRGFQLTCDEWGNYRMSSGQDPVKESGLAKVRVQVA